MIGTISVIIPYAIIRGGGVQIVLTPVRRYKSKCVHGFHCGAINVWYYIRVNTLFNGALPTAEVFTFFPSPRVFLATMFDGRGYKLRIDS